MSVGMAGTRIEKDSFGPIEVPAERLWGAQTERSRRFFRISGERMPLAVASQKRYTAAAQRAEHDLAGRRAERRRDSASFHIFQSGKFIQPCAADQRQFEAHAPSLNA